MTVQNLLSLILFALLEISVFTRAAVLRKKGVRVLVLGQTDKNVYLLVLSVCLVVYAAMADTFGLPMWNALLRPFWHSRTPGWFGLLVCFAAAAGFVLTIFSLGESFRVGIDADKPGGLITGGVFAVSRNPVYLCLIIFFAGLFLIHKNIAVTASAILSALVLHRQILREERFLAARYGAEFESYRKKTRRYF